MILNEQLTFDNIDPPQHREGQQVFGITILELKFSSCRYVVGQNEDDETLFCGEVIHRVSYCRHHYSACYVRAKTTRAD